MDPSLAQEMLKIMGIHIDEKKMRVLAAILHAQSKSSSAVTFKDLKMQLESDEGRNSVTDSLIYRLLTELEDDKLIKVDRTDYRHTYSTGFTNIHRGLEHAAQEALKEIDYEIEDIDSEIDSLSNLDLSDFARSALKIITGRKHQIKSISALGKDGFENLLLEKIFSDCSKHDLIRIAMDIQSVDDDIQSIFLNSLQVHSKNMFKVQLLFTHSLTEDQTKQAIKRFNRIKSAGCDACIRVYNQQTELQNFISRNTEGVLLVPSDYPPVSVWIPRILNSSLVENTITLFDLEFSKVVDVMGEDV